MKLHKEILRSAAIGLAAAALEAYGGNDNNNAPPAIAAQFKSKILVSDGSLGAPDTDADLKNGWDIAFNPTGPVWVSDNDTRKSTL